MKRMMIAIVLAMMAAVTRAHAMGGCTITTPGVVYLKDCQCHDVAPSRTDTQCWQDALDSALDLDDDGTKDSSYLMGVVHAQPGHFYDIEETLVLDSAQHGTIEGHGAQLLWKGSYTPPSGTPSALGSMFLFSDTTHVALRNIHLQSTTGHRLWAAIEFTNGPNNHIDPTLNILDRVVTEGEKINGMDYAVIFDVRYGSEGDGVYDAMNDQSTIVNSAFYNVMKAAISIQGVNSHQHRIQGVTATGAVGPDAGDDNGDGTNDDVDAFNPSVHLTGASFVRLKSGGFTAVHGFRANFKNAEFYIEKTATPVTIIDSNSELCARFIRTKNGYALTHGNVVSVVGGRFAVEGIDSSGRIVEWYRQGPVSIRGMFISGDTPEGVEPHFYFAPSPPAEGSETNEAPFEVAYCDSYLANSNTWDLVEANEYARVVTRGNMCSDDAPSNGASVPCKGYGGDMDARMSTAYADLPSTVPNGTVAYCSDCAPRTSPCSGSGTGATATRLNGSWDCGGVSVDDLPNAEADGTTKGAASFTAADFNDASGNISIDYANGQAASGSNKGFLTSADWTTFNGKVGSSTTDTLTNKTLDSAATGNVITIPFTQRFAPVRCTADGTGNFSDGALPTSNAPSGSCVTGTNTHQPVLDFADSATQTWYISQLLPADTLVSSGFNLKLVVMTTATSGSSVFQAQTSCVASDGTETNDPTWNSVATATISSSAVASKPNSGTIALSTTGCAAGEILHVKVFRDPSHGSDTISATARLLYVELTLKRQM